MTVAVVILNWNGKKLLERYLPSVVRHSKNANIYVADNASTDDSLAFLSENYPEIKILKNTENFGFAGGYNEALKQVDEDIYVLLNNDVEVTEGWLDNILYLFKTSNDIAVIQPKIKSTQNKHKFDYAGAAGGFLDSLGYPFCRGRIFDTIEGDEGQYDEDIEIFWASGACFCVRRECFRKVKGFDQDYFAHQEEIDLCWRLKNIGYSIWCCHKSVVYHQGGGTLSNVNPRKTFLNFRNSLFNLLKNSKKNPFAKIVLRMILDGIAAIRFLLKGNLKHFFAIFMAHISFYSFMNKMIKKRKKLKQNEQEFVVKSIVWHNYFLRLNTYNQIKINNN